MSGRGQSWGVRGYEAVKKYLDPEKIKQENENFLIACNKKKAPKQKPVDLKAKRINVIDQTINHTKSLPAPWTYVT